MDDEMHARQTDGRVDGWMDGRTVEFYFTIMWGYEKVIALFIYIYKARLLC